jgi:hypothetical protein
LQRRSHCPMPDVCYIRGRPIDLHVHGLEALGAQVDKVNLNLKPSPIQRDKFHGYGFLRFCMVLELIIWNIFVACLAWNLWQKASSYSIGAYSSCGVQYYLHCVKEVVSHVDTFGWDFKPFEMALEKYCLL